MTSICIIPARGGSKRIPRKNINEFCGKSIIAYSIEAALKSGLFSEVMVSTDDTEIAEVARKYGAKVPFMRSVNNSDDHATTVDVLLEVMNKYKELGQEFDVLCCLYPVAPFVTADKLINALNIFNCNKAEVVLPIVKYSYPIQRSLKIVDGYVQMLYPDNYSVRSQDFEDVYHDAGQFYIIRSTALIKDLNLFSERAFPIIVPEIEVQDIDNLQDWLIAELKYKYLKV